VALKLPRLCTDIDCGPIGYPGLVVTLWLNPSIDEYTPPEKKREPWESEYYHSLARMFERVTLPGDYTEDGQERVIEVTDARALWELEHRPDFDPQILLWTASQYAQQRAERLRTEAKN
jgi:hypothetical protein